MTTIAETRRDLAAAIANRERSAAALSRAQAAHDRAQAFLAEVQRETEALRARQRQSEDAAAETFAAQLRSDTARADISGAEVVDTLATTRTAVLQAEAREAVVKASATALAGELASAKALLAGDDERLGRAAFAVIVAEAEKLVDELEAARAIVIDRRARIRALGRAPLPPARRVSAAVESARRAVYVADKPDPTYAPSNDPEAKAVAKLNAYYAALIANADATYPE